MEEDMSQLSFRDDVWLQYYSLNSVSVLDYFSFSGFYDRTCNNEMVKMQRQSVLKMKEMVGIEYEVIVPPPKYFDDPFGQKCVVQQTSNLFVIQKQYRHTPDQVSSLAVYYCLYGSIYQGLAPLFSASSLILLTWTSLKFFSFSHSLLLSLSILCS